MLRVLVGRDRAVMASRSVPRLFVGGLSTSPHPYDDTSRGWACLRNYRSLEKYGLRKSGWCKSFGITKRWRMPKSWPFYLFLLL